mgnify:CR=1 FL=1
MDIWKELKQEGVDSGLLEEVRAFRDAHPAPPEAAGRVPRPRFLYYGKEVWEGAAAALLCGEHLLLAAPPGTCPCTSTWTPPPSSERTPSRMDRLPSGRALSASAPGWGASAYWTR